LNFQGVFGYLFYRICKFVLKLKIEEIDLKKSNCAQKSLLFSSILCINLLLQRNNCFLVVQEVNYSNTKVKIKFYFLKGKGKPVP